MDSNFFLTKLIWECGKNSENEKVKKVSCTKKFITFITLNIFDS